MTQNTVLQNISESRAGTLKLVGGRLCLDFANTVDWHTSDHPEECLKNPNDLTLWGLHTGLFSEDQARELIEAIGEKPDRAERELQEVRNLRDAIFEIFLAVVRNREPSSKHLTVLNRHLPRPRVVRTRSGFEWDFFQEAKAVERILIAAARSAGDLLVSDELSKVKICDDDNCGWLFLDSSRNQSRRWCQMEDCGNRSKARRFYNRKKKKE